MFCLYIDTDEMSGFKRTCFIHFQNGEKVKKSTAKTLLQGSCKLPLNFFPLRLKYLEKSQICFHLRSFETKGLAVATLLK